MKLVRSLAMSLVFAVVAVSPALAWEDDGSDGGWWWPDPPAWEPPMQELPMWEPVWEMPEWEPPTWEWAPVEVPPPADWYAPEGIYLVTEVYVRDVVTIEEARTVYSTESAYEVPGTYARELETVATGSASVYDDAAFNGRTALTDGRPVAGTFYESFTLTDSGFESIGVVFFQDDAEMARLAQPNPPASGAPARDATAVHQPHDAIVGTPAGSSAGSLELPASSAAEYDRPRDEWRDIAARLPSPGDRSRDVRARFAPLGARGDARVIEVLRGRRMTLHPSATVDGSSASIASWRLLSGEGVTSTAAGMGTQPFVARWDRLAPPGAAWRLRFEVVVGTTEPVTTEAIVDVLVIAPALIS